MANTTIIMPKSRVAVSIMPERTAGYTHRFQIKSSDIACGTTNADTVTVTLGTTPTRWMVTRCIANVTTAFAGASANLLIVGTTTGTSTFLASVTTLTAGVLVPSTGPNTVATIASASGSAAVVMQAVFTGGIPANLSAGQVDIYLSLIDLDTLP